MTVSAPTENESDADIKTSAQQLKAEQPSRRTVSDFIKQQPLGTIGFLIIVILFLSAIFAPDVAPYDPEEVDFMASPALGGGAPGSEHLLGGDAFGRDILSR